MSSVPPSAVAAKLVIGYAGGVVSGAHVRPPSMLVARPDTSRP